MAWILVLCGLAGFVIGLPSKPRDDRGDFHIIVKEFWEWRLREVPEFATSVGHQEYDDRLEVFTLAVFTRRKEKCEEFASRLDAIDAWRLTPREAIDLAVLKYDIKAYIDGYQWRLYGGLNPINFLEGIHKDYSWWLDAMRFRDGDGFRRYIVRLRALASQIYQQINLMREAIRRGVTNHRVSVMGVISQMPRMDVQAVTTPFYRPFNDSLDFADVSSNLAEKLREEGGIVVEDQVMPAYRKLKTFISKEYLTNTRLDTGVGMTGKGLAYYKACLRWHLSLEMSPYTLHDIGVQTVVTITDRLLLLQKRTGYVGKLTDFIRYAHGASKFFFKTEQDILKKYTNLLQVQINHTKLNKVFYRSYLSPPIVQPMSFDGPLGVMMPGSEDGSMPAIFFVNVQNPVKRPRWEMLRVALHETFPGRYLQGSYLRNQSVPMFRKYREFRKMYAIPFQFPYHAAYTEGWALYAESLGHDMELYADPYDEFGQLYSELRKACEIVVDTGIHAHGWSRGEAADYLLRTTAASSLTIERNINRMVTLPGQAVAPEFGHLKIKQLRKRAENRFGGRFDVKEFHDRILRLGPVPLTLLELEINRWIDMYAPKPSAAAVNRNPFFSLCLCLGFLFLVTQNTAEEAASNR